jgi:hypothetical protein
MEYVMLGLEQVINEKHVHLRVLPWPSEFPFESKIIKSRIQKGRTGPSCRRHHKEMQKTDRSMLATAARKRQQHIWFHDFVNVSNQNNVVCMRLPSA